MDIAADENIKRILLTVAYDGTAYCGWQLQPNGRTIEGEIIKAIENVTGQTVSLTGASRTDAGVHALCNKAVFDTEAKMPPEKYAPALNTYLPDDIRIISSKRVADDFHPRRVPTEKTYEYRIFNASVSDPTKRLYSYFTYTPLDVGSMKKAAAYFVGTHDFAAVSTYKPEVTSTVRTISDISVETDAADMRMITIKVTGNGFLYHMVRIIAGTLMEVGRGRTDAKDIPGILASKDRNKAGPTAPACGLTLKELRFTGADEPCADKQQ